LGAAAASVVEETPGMVVLAALVPAAEALGTRAAAIQAAVADSTAEVVAAALVALLVAVAAVAVAAAVAGVVVVATIRVSCP